jgi:quercetin dioxygenase-like cupin family protein
MKGKGIVMTENWEEIEVPRGSFISWADKPGQIVQGAVVTYDPRGGTDFNDQPCPQVIIDLTAHAESINKAGEVFEYDAGDMVTVNAGQANLAKALRKADPQPGDLLKITYADTEKSAKGTVKVFAVKIARGSGTARPKATSTRQSSEPPF